PMLKWNSTTCSMSMRATCWPWHAIPDRLKTRASYCLRRPMAKARKPLPQNGRLGAQEKYSAICFPEITTPFCSDRVVGSLADILKATMGCKCSTATLGLPEERNLEWRYDIENKHVSIGSEALGK